MLYLTNEMKSMVVNPLYTGYWLDIIASIRDVFSGEISLNAIINNDVSTTNTRKTIAASEVMNIPFADQLDFVGVSFYLPYTDKDDPTEGELESAWYGNRDGVNLIKALKDIYRQYGKPVMISEIGYMSRDGVNRRPWDLRTVGVVDYQEQADLFEALMQVLTREALSAEEEWLRGVSIWEWFTCLNPATQLPARGANAVYAMFGDEGEVVQNKPAEAVLTEWFHRLGGREPPGTSEGAGVVDRDEPVVLYDYSHSQGLALNEDDATAINAEHPEWYTLAGLAPHVAATHASGDVSTGVLKGCNIYVIAAPRRSFSSAELAALEDFVFNGGGLLLIGNAWAAPVTFDGFDVGFSCYPIGEPVHLRYHDFASFYVSNLGEHPVTLVGSIRVNWSSTMEVGPDWLVLAETSEDAWQEQTGDQIPSPGETRGPFPILAVRQFGQGRMVAISDDHPFWDQGNRPLVQNILKWLAGK